MVRFPALLILIAVVAAPCAARPLGPECTEHAEGSTLQESCLLQRELEGLERDLDSTYKRLLRQWRSEESKKERVWLVEAQRAWLNYRDKTCEFEQAVHGGSLSISAFRCIVRLADERVKYLREFL